MTILGLILSLALVGLLVYLIVTFVPMPAQIQQLIVIVAVLICLLIVLQAFGVLGAVDTRVPQVGGN